jgi:heme exporter protein D
MTDMGAFFDMGGYAAYVWPAYGLSLAALGVLSVISWRWMKRVERLAEASKSVAPDKQDVR